MLTIRKNRKTCLYLQQFKQLTTDLCLAHLHIILIHTVYILQQEACRIQSVYYIKQYKIKYVALHFIKTFVNFITIT